MQRLPTKRLMITQSLNNGCTRETIPQFSLQGVMLGMYYLLGQFGLLSKQCPLPIPCYPPPCCLGWGQRKQPAKPQCSASILQQQLKRCCVLFMVTNLNCGTMLAAVREPDPVCLSRLGIHL